MSASHTYSILCITFLCAVLLAAWVSMPGSDM